MLDDLSSLLPTSKATWVLVISGVTTLAFALSAFAFDRSGHRIISPFFGAECGIKVGGVTDVTTVQISVVGLTIGGSLFLCPRQFEPLDCS